MAAALLNQAANERHFFEPAGRQGAFQGECFRATCKTVGAAWYHKSYRRYYCGSCAAEINRERALQGEPVACINRG